MDFGFWITEEKGYHHFSLNTKASTLISGYMSILAAWESTNGEWMWLMISDTFWHKLPIDGNWRCPNSLPKIIPHRIHGAAIYGNMDPINIPPMGSHIYQHHGSYGYPNIVCGFSTSDWRFSRLPWPSHDPPRCVSYAQPFGRQGRPGPNGSQPTELGHFGPPVVAHSRPPWWLPGRCGERSPPHPAILRGPVRLRELPEWFGGFVKELCIQHLQNEEGPPKTEVNLERGAVLRFFWIFCWHYSQLLYYTYSYI